MKRTNLILAMVLGLLMMLTLCYSSQAQTQAVSLDCQMNGNSTDGWPAGTYNILIEADMSIVTVTMPNGGNLYYKPRGKYQGAGDFWCTDYIEATSAMYNFGYNCDYSTTRIKIDRISGEITLVERIGGYNRSYKGTCTKTEIQQKF